MSYFFHEFLRNLNFSDFLSICYLPDRNNNKKNRFGCFFNLWFSIWPGYVTLLLTIWWWWWWLSSKTTKKNIDFVHLLRGKRCDYHRSFRLLFDDDDDNYVTNQPKSQKPIIIWIGQTNTQIVTIFLVEWSVDWSIMRFFFLFVWKKWLVFFLRTKKSIEGQFFFFLLTDFWYWFFDLKVINVFWPLMR